MHVPTLLLLPAFAAAATIQIEVGASGLSFNPDSTMAKEGDVLMFTIHPTHNVAQSTFDKPCSPIDSHAIYSGNDATSFAVTVNDTKPLWFYCSTPGHCSQGMVLAVNPPADQTIDDFKKNAAMAGEGTAPSSVNGGVVNGAGGGSSSSSASGSGSSMMTASSSMGTASSSAMPSGSSMSASGTGSASGTSTGASGGQSSTGLGSFVTPPPAAMVVAGGILGMAYLL